MAERNRREQLIAVSEQAAQDEGPGARAARAVGCRPSLSTMREHEQAIAAHRAAVHERDEAAEERRRLQAAIARRRDAPDEGPGAGRRAQLRAELLSEQAGRDRAERERAERSARIEQCRVSIERDERLVPAIAALIEVLRDVTETIEQRRAEFDAALAADREAGEHVAARASGVRTGGGRRCRARLHARNEALTSLEVRAQRARDQADDAAQLLETLALELRAGGRPGDRAARRGLAADADGTARAPRAPP